MGKRLDISSPIFASLLDPRLMPLAFKNSCYKELDIEMLKLIERREDLTTRLSLDLIHPTSVSSATPRPRKTP